MYSSVEDPPPKSTTPIRVLVWHRFRPPMILIYDRSEFFTESGEVVPTEDLRCWAYLTPPPANEFRMI